MRVAQSTLPQAKEGSAMGDGLGRGGGLGSEGVEVGQTERMQVGKEPRMAWIDHDGY